MSPRKKTDKPFSSKITAPWVDPLTQEQVPISAIPLAEIQPRTQQPRRYFDPEALTELIASVKQHGILQPLLVRPRPSGGYELVAGERRYRAAQEIGLTQVPVYIRDLNDHDAFQLALIENLQREDLNPLEETESILQLLSGELETTVEEAIAQLYRLENEAKGKVTRNVTGKKIIASIDKVFYSVAQMNWQSFVRNRLPILNLHKEILSALREGKIAYTKAVVIAKVKDEQARASLLAETIEDNLSLSKIKERISLLQSREEKASDSMSLRLKTAYQKVKKSKVWENPQKRKQLEKLLSQLEALTSE